jgi:anti-sigma regulatory factor (Ser/Thr protein kinase)
MARPRQAPQRSINRLTTRTDRVTPVSYNETKRIRKHDSRDGMMPEPALIKIQMLGRLQHRDLVLRSVAAACKLVNPRVDTAWNDFRTQVVTAVGEAFNNVVLHSYEGQDEGLVEIEIQTRPDHISIELRDWGESFDPDSVPLPDFESLPESGFGIFIIKTLMEIQYTPGKPNVLTLSKSLVSSAEQQNNVDGET